MFYSSDTYPSPPVGSEDTIAEMYFRLQVDQISHSREVYTFMMFLGNLGGVSELLLQLAGLLIGGYASFHSSFATIAALYLHKNEGDPIFSASKWNNPANPSVQKIKLPLSTRVFLYFLSTPLKLVLNKFKSPIHDRQ